MTRRRLVLLGFVGVVVLLLPAYLRAFVLSGASDAPTLLLGDKVLVNEAAYSIRLPYTQVRLLRSAHPRRGDLVLVQRPDGPERVFKRVLGLPGETFEMRDNRVIINGQPLSLKALPRSEFTWIPPSHRMGNTVYDEDGHWVAFTPEAGDQRDLAPVRLKSDEYFLLGDNRDVSLDGRQWGPVKEESIFGKIILTLPTGPRNR